MRHFSSVMSSIEMSEGQEASRTAFTSSGTRYKRIVPRIVRVYVLDVSILTKTSFDGNCLLQISKPAACCCLAHLVIWLCAFSDLELPRCSVRSDILNFRKAFFSVGRKTGVMQLSCRSTFPLNSILKIFLFLKGEREREKKRSPLLLEKGWDKKMGFFISSYFFSESIAKQSFWVMHIYFFKVRAHEPYYFSKWRNYSKYALCTNSPWM